jgi:beta-phosphoglucomutase-like phosphatase (HAD superfamily)
MIKTIIFDLDGVLVEAKKLHYDCLNNALFEEDPKFIIKWNEHLSLYDGLKTNQKLDLLHSNKGLPKDSFIRVWEKKQKLTLESLQNLLPSQELIYCMKKLS